MATSLVPALNPSLILGVELFDGMYEVENTTSIPVAAQININYLALRDLGIDPGDFVDKLEVEVRTIAISGEDQLVENEIGSGSAYGSDETPEAHCLAVVACDATGLTPGLTPARVIVKMTGSITDGTTVVIDAARVAAQSTPLVLLVTGT